MSDSSTNFSPAEPERSTFTTRYVGPLFYLLAGCALAACDHLPASPVMAQLVEHTGQVSLLPKRDQLRTAPPDVTAPSLVAPGTAIETGAGSTATLTLLPGMIIQLQPEAKLEVRRAVLVKNGNQMADIVQSKRARVELLHGSIAATTPGSGTHADLQISTPVALLSATVMATFHVSLDAAKRDDTPRRGVHRAVRFFRGDKRASRLLLGVESCGEEIYGGTAVDRSR